MNRLHPVLVLLVILMVSCTGATGKRNSLLVLRGATVFDGNGNTLENGTVIINGDSIHAIGGEALEIPLDAEILDMSGKFITPGLVDTHVHFGQTGFFDGRPDALDLRDSLSYVNTQAGLQEHPERYFDTYLRSGVTAVYDVGGYLWSIALGKRTENDPEAPHVAGAGPLLTPVSQEALAVVNTPGQRQLLELTDAEYGREVVRQNTALGSTGIKIWQLSLGNESFMESLDAVAKETFALGNQLIVHATDLDQAKAAVGLGAKVLVHSVDNAVVDEEFLQMALEHQMVYTPTLVVLKGYYNASMAVLDGGFELKDPHSAVDTQTRELLLGAEKYRALVDTAQLRMRTRRLDTYIREIDSIMAINLRKVNEAGITIAVGTDAGNPGTLHGISIFDELEAMQDAGIQARELIPMATRNGAIAMRRQNDFGTLEPGKLADLLVMDKDPSQDVANFRSITHVIRAGKLRSVLRIRNE